MQKILIVEDEVKIREELATFLKNNGYDILTVNDFNNTLEDILSKDVDLILLDINIPGINGMHLCREIRKKKNVPIMIVTSRNNEIDELICMNFGADDFITKPYNLQILLAHMEAILKRSKPEISHVLKYEGMVVNLSKGVLEYAGKTVLLTKNELSILAYLLKNRGSVVSRDDLISFLWDSEVFTDDNTLTVNITRLRKKLEEIGFKNVIETRRGWGYIIL